VTRPSGHPIKTYKDILPRTSPDDRAYVEIIGKVAAYTMTLNEGLETTYALFQAIKYIVQNRIPGDMVECGVWRGGSMMLIAYALAYFGDTNRRLLLYDTFAGMTEPDDIDIDYDRQSNQTHLD
jgi:O-methyltransferase